MEESGEGAGRSHGGRRPGQGGAIARRSPGDRPAIALQAGAGGACRRRRAALAQKIRPDCRIKLTDRSINPPFRRPAMPASAPEWWKGLAEELQDDIEVDAGAGGGVGGGPAAGP